jgi:hypothetical protein
MPTIREQSKTQMHEGLVPGTVPGGRFVALAARAGSKALGLLRALATPGTPGLLRRPSTALAPAPRFPAAGRNLHNSTDLFAMVASWNGSSLTIHQWPYLREVLGTLAARETDHPVMLILNCAQLFSAAGHRPRDVQRLMLGAIEAEQEGRLAPDVRDEGSDTKV